MKISRYSLSSFEQLSADWRQLSQGPDMTAFQSYEWYAATREKARRERLSRLGVQHKIYVVRDGTGQPLLIAPLRIHLTNLSNDHRRGIHLMGRNGSADYLNFVYREFSPETAARVLDSVRGDYHVRTVRLERVLAETATARWLATTAASSTSDAAVAVSVPDLPTAYSSILSKRARQNIRTARNRIDKDGLELAVTFGGAPVAEQTQKFTALKRSRDAARRTGGRQRGIRRVWGRARRAYLSSLFTPLAEPELLMTRHPLGWHMQVTLDGELAAFAFGLMEHWQSPVTLRVLQVAYDERFGRYSPGLLGLHSYLTSLAQAGDPMPRVVDFTRGEEPYKFTLGGRVHHYLTAEL